MELTAEERDALIKYRMEKAKETLAEIQVLTANNLWRNAANRLYYSCFYAASALLLNDGHRTLSHNGAKSLLSYHYVKDNKIDKDLIKTYGQLFNMRQRGDYEDWVTIDETDVRPLIEPAKRFIATVEKLLE